MNKKGRHPFKRLAACFLATAVALVSSGCGAEEEKPLIYVIGQSQGISFWDMVQSGAEDAGEELSYTIVYENAQSTSDIDGQKALIRKAISDKAKAIVLAPNDPSKLNDDISEAEKAGIQVIAIDAPLDKTKSSYITYIGTDNLSAGEIAGRNANKNILVDHGQLAIISHSTTSEAARSRVKGFKSMVKILTDEELEKLAAQAAGTAAGTASQEGEGAEEEEEIKGTQLLFDESCNGDENTATELANRAITMHMSDDKLKKENLVIFTTNEKSTTGACKALENLLEGKSNEEKEEYMSTIHIIGFNSNDAEIGYLMSGILTGTIVQSPYNMGYLGVRYAGKLLQKVDIDGEMVTPSIPINVDTGATYIDTGSYSNDISQLLIKPDTYGEIAGGEEE